MRYAALFALAILAGCAAQAATPHNAGPSYRTVDGRAIRIDGRAVRRSPLYPALLQLDRQIEALRATVSAPEFARADGAIAHAQNAVRSELGRDAGATQRIAAASAPPMNAPPAAEYRSRLLAQEQAAYAQYVRGVNERVNQAYQARAQQLYEKESTLKLELARRDAPQVLTIRSKLETLVLQPPQRAQLFHQLQTIVASEDARVAQLHAQDAAELRAFAGPLRAQAAQDVAAMHAQLQMRTAANLAARDRVNAPASQLRLLAQAQPADPAAFMNAGSALQNHFAGVQNANSAAQRAMRGELSALQADRNALYNLIVSQLRHR
jgi:hypothetical protein